MSYLDLVPDGHSAGDTVHRFGITKAANGRARQTLVQSAWYYCYSTRNGQAKHYRYSLPWGWSLQ
jgi:transposase